jgi:hypothetical protein
MTDKLRDLGRRAIACRGWKWMDGMLDGAQSGWRYDAQLNGFLVCDETNIGDVTAIDAFLESVEPNSLPDLSDPATLGCLLALVRSALKDDTVYVRYFPDDDVWCVGSGKLVASLLVVNGKNAEGKSEAEALIAALEAAP